MTEPPSRVLRVLVPVLLLLAAIGVGWAVMRNTSKPTAPVSPPANTPATTPGQSPPPANPPANPPASPVADPPASGEAPASPTGAPTPAPAPPAASDGLLDGLRARPLTADEAARPLEPLGTLDDPGRPVMLEFSPYGAGLRSVKLAKYFQTLDRKPTNHVVVQRERRFEFTQGGFKRAEIAAPLGAARVTINGVGVPLFGIANPAGADAVDEPIWRQTAPGAFEAVIVNESGREIVRITRAFELVPGLHVVHLRHRIENLTDQPLSIRLFHYGPVDMEFEALGYGGDRRRVAFGYLSKPSMDPSRQLVLTEAYSLLMRGTVFSSKEPTVWPRKTSREAAQELVWFGMASRHFGAVVFPLVDPTRPAPGLSGPDKVFRAVEAVYGVVLEAALYDKASIAPEKGTLALQLCSPLHTVPAGQAVASEIGVYAGPLSRDALEADPITKSLGLGRLPVYNMGGPCAPCTFEWLANLLAGLLHTLHDYVFQDWALSIIVLVLIVRTMLHPVTKWSQIRMTRFGKQMQELGPKQKKIQEKYKDDTKKLREETAKLWREEGVSPAGMLGCIPAFLQTPIWIALYATLFFDFDLRHHGAFFGFFQWITGDRWWFLGDLSSPDHFVRFGTEIHIPLLGALLGPVTGLHVLPLLLGVVFFIQMKYLQPPQTGQLSPEQEQTQRITKVMMVVMFPLLMYNAPSGLALYFLTNSTLGIMESKYIRSHIDKYDLGKPKPRGGGAGPAVRAGKPGGGGFMARLQARLEERQRQLARQRQTKRRG